MKRGSLFLFILFNLLINQKGYKQHNSSKKENKSKNTGNCKMQEMKKIQIQGNKDNKIKACYELITNGTVQCFKKDRYRVPKYCLNVLNKKGIYFKEI